MKRKMVFGAVLLLLLAGGACAVRKISRIPVPVSCYIYDQCGGVFCDGPSLQCVYR